MKRIKKLLTAFMVSLVLLCGVSVICPDLAVTTVKAATIKINKTKITLIKGQKYKLKIIGTKSKVTWKSSKKSIASVNAKGVVTAKKIGTAKITGKVGNKKFQCKVKVKAKKVTEETNKTEVTNETEPENIFTVSSQEVIVDGTAEIILTSHNNGTVTYAIENENIVSCEWADNWEGDTLKLTFTGNNVGQTKVTITSSNNKVLTINVNVIRAADVTKQNLIMAAAGISCAYIYAKFPSTLHINTIQYENNLVNVYGEPIDRMVIRCYAGNSLGGYSYMYVVVIKCLDNTHYPDATVDWGGYFLSTSCYNEDPGMRGNFLDNKAALDTYHNLYNNDRPIQYD